MTVKVGVFALCRLGIYVQSFWVIQQNPAQNSKITDGVLNKGRVTDIHACLSTGLVLLVVWIWGWIVWGRSWEFLRERWGWGWREREREREIFWPLVAFTTQAQIIEGHGNLSDRWTMLPFSNPLWTGPSIMGEEINSIHQLFVSLGPLMPPYIAQEGGYKCLWTWCEPACLTPN